MRVLYVSHCHPPEKTDLKSVGGMQRVSRQLAHYLATEVDVVPMVQATSWTAIGIKTCFFMIGLLVRIPYAVLRYRPDVILFSSMVTAGMAVVLKPLVRTRFVAIAHGQDVTMPIPIYQAWLRRVFAALDGVICVSRATRLACIERSLDPSKSAALGNGFDGRDMNDCPDREASRKALLSQFGIGKRRMLLTVGRMVRRKGHAWFVQNVLPQVAQDVDYVIIGDGPEWNAIRAAVEEAGLGDRVHMLGRQPDEVLKQAYSAADLFIMPNIPVPGDMEGFGVVLLEANLAGTPTIASDLEGIRDIIVNGENGWRVAPLDPQAFADTIDRILQSDLEAFSQRAHDYVRLVFSWEDVTRSYVRFLDSVRSRNFWEVSYVPA